MSRQSAKRPIPEVMRQLLDYDPMTGILTWKPRGIEWFKGPRAATHMRRWNVLYAGKEAFTSCDAAGYRQGSILKYRTKAHRVILAMVNGKWPDQGDHINGVRDDNRLKNLRDVDAFQNMKNTKAMTKSSGLPPGVYFRKARPKNPYEVMVRVDGKQRYIGRFSDPEVAHHAYRVALRRHGYSPRHGRQITERAT